jgi:hypothetical protein
VQQTTSSFHQAFPLIIYERKISGFLSSLYNSFEDGKFDNSTGKITGELNGKVLIHQDIRLAPFNSPVIFPVELSNFPSSKLL